MSQPTSQTPKADEQLRKLREAIKWATEVGAQPQASKFLGGPLAQTVMVGPEVLNMWRARARLIEENKAAFEKAANQGESADG